MAAGIPRFAFATTHGAFLTIFVALGWQDSAHTLFVMPMRLVLRSPGSLLHVLAPTRGVVMLSLIASACRWPRACSMRVTSPMEAACERATRTHIETLVREVAPCTPPPLAGLVMWWFPFGCLGGMCDVDRRRGAGRGQQGYSDAASEREREVCATQRCQGVNLVAGMGPHRSAHAATNHALSRLHHRDIVVCRRCRGPISPISHDNPGHQALTTLFLPSRAFRDRACLQL